MFGSRHSMMILNGRVNCVWRSAGDVRVAYGGTGVHIYILPCLHTKGPRTDCPLLSRKPKVR